jgi:Na+/proline symporter
LCRLSLRSTADSYIISISNIFVTDIYKGLYRPQADDASQIKVGKVCSVVAVLLTLPLVAADVALTPLFAFQGTALAQLLPAFLLGLYTNIGPRPLIIGCGAGLVVMTTGNLASSMGGVTFAVNVTVLSLSANFILVGLARLVLKPAPPPPPSAVFLRLEPGGGGVSGGLSFKRESRLIEVNERREDGGAFSAFLWLLAHFYTS